MALVVGVSVVLRHIGLALSLTWSAANGIITRLMLNDPLAFNALAKAVWQFVWRPLPTLIGLSTLVGLISGVLVARVLGIYNAELVVIGALDQTLVRQLVPLVIGIFVSGSVAVELATRTGAMSLANEIDGYESLGHDPASYVLGGPLIAILIATPLHMGVSAAFSIVSSGIPLGILANTSALQLIRIATSEPVVLALLQGLGKVVLFAWLAFAVGAVAGTTIIRQPAQIGQIARSAFTTGLLITFAAAALLVALP